MVGTESSKLRRGALPPGFLALAFTEHWERFSLAGLKSMLTLLLIDHVLDDKHGVAIGIEWTEHLFETLFGPLTTIGLASQIYGLTNALLYLAIPVGGLLGDRIAGRRGAVYIGGGAMFAALVLMIGERFFLAALPLFAFGAGTIKGNLSVIVGRLFVDDAERRRGFAVYLGFLNAGVICGPLLCGAVAAWGGWRLALGAAAAAIALGVAGFHAATMRSAAPATAVPRVSPSDAAARQGRSNIALVGATLLALYLCFAAYEQVGNIFLVWARARTAIDFPAPWLVSLDGLFTLALIPLAQLCLRLLARRGITIDAPAQIALGCGLCALGNLVLAAADSAYGDRVPLAAAFAYLLLVDCAIVLVWPAGLSLVMEAAPVRLAGFWVGLFYLHGFFANLWVGFGGALYERMTASSFWLLHAALAAAAALVATASTLFVPMRETAPQEATTTSA